MNEQASIPELPKTVTRITVQKKNKTRYSLFQEEEFILGVSDGVLSRFNIRKGTIINSELYNALLEAEDSWKIREYLLRLLSRRDHAAFELKQKALKKGYTSAQIEEHLQELQDKGYINNQIFAEKFARDKFEFNNWGPTKIRAELIRKGIAPKDADHAVSQIRDHDQMIETLEQLILKRKAKILRDDPAKRKKKLFDFLLRKGYDSSVILKEIDRLLKRIGA